MRQLVSLLMIIMLWMGTESFNSDDVPTITLDQLPFLTENVCILLKLSDDRASSDLFFDLRKIFEEEERISFARLPEPMRKFISWKEERGRRNSHKFALYRRVAKDRSCLLLPRQSKPSAEIVPPDVDLRSFMAFINEACVTFRHLDGSLDEQGRKRDEILNNFYKVPETSSDQGTANCERIKKMPNQREFFQNYIAKSKPVIIENVAKSWPAMQKWSNNYLRAAYGHTPVHVKATPNGIFEGCEPASGFQNHNTFKIPDAVREKLLFPDLVVVRPATLDVSFSKFIDLIEQRPANISAYLEYSSIKTYFPKLLPDVPELPSISRSLRLSATNMWLSGGDTLGKLHFDPFDNLLVQLSGSKELTLFAPHNNQDLYEAHIQEALLSYDPLTLKFHRHRLLDSTAMVMSPVDIRALDSERFVNFSRARPLRCVIREGDALFMPSFWWHEVQSYPSRSGWLNVTAGAGGGCRELDDEGACENEVARNLAVNFWYKPFLTKEFPCPECRLDVHEDYRFLLDML